jgi:hypothetical protein
LDQAPILNLTLCVALIGGELVVLGCRFIRLLNALALRVQSTNEPLQIKASQDLRVCQPLIGCKTTILGRLFVRLIDALAYRVEHAQQELKIQNKEKRTCACLLPCSAASRLYLAACSCD